MKWMETIKVQSASRREQITEYELMHLACDVRNNPDCQGLLEVKVSSHATVPGCFALILFWDTGDLRPGGSLLGMGLAQSLKVLGLVDHSVWIENT